MNKKLWLQSILFLSAIFAGSGALAQNTFPSTGNVGIGTTSPTNSLEVFSSTAASTVMAQTNWTSGYAGFYAASNTVSAKMDVTNGGNAAFGTLTSSPLVFVTGNGERARFDAGGNFGIGTTTPIFDGNWMTSTFFAVANATAHNWAEIGIGANATATTDEGGMLAFYNSSLTATDKRNAAIISFNDGATNSGTLDFYTWSAGTSGNRMRITSAGKVGIGLTSPTYQLQLSTDSAAKPGTSAWTIASDARLKDVRAPFTRGLEAIDGIHPIYFRYKEGNALNLPTDKEYVGIIAQDAQAVVPESVQADAKGYLHLTNDSIMWTMLNAIKELKQENSDLKARLARLEKMQSAK
jgi:hypothetical protein